MNIELIFYPYLEFSCAIIFPKVIFDSWIDSRWQQWISKHQVCASALFCVNKKFCKVALSSLKSVPTPCPRSFSLLFSGAKTKRPGALEPGIQSSRSMVEMITRLTMSQRSFPICYKNPFLASAQYLNRGQLPQSAIYENFFVLLAR